ncbi:Npun_F0296 family exosortase-dependent surface protein [Paracraurococcus ruber]|uniref:Ice-binding protein C-terminal domain-containing protein n=1 Tax=Paracraurococcus ruber TaxID=77675 RepID=A0ABS1D703_9PROT|nr:PEP-CTERM sorting domain-containing protein [Paracraurococcus ruber]MBK1662268.1 hypothetical protein [Paracraurococcus ruber]TDG30254.1 PEP-CTERM sorting domain-containing protein [Paracraurococcus ruber]
MSLRHLLLSGFAALTLGAATAEASPLSIVSSVGGAPTGAVRENFDDLALGNTSGQTTATGITVQIGGDAAIVQGSVGGRYAAPSLSGGNGAGFGPGGTAQGDGANGTAYLTTGSTGTDSGSAITLLLPSAMQYFGLLWGSVDGYNTLSFFKGNSLVGAVTGGDVAPLPNGDQGPQGTRYVNITSSTAFDRVVATSSSYAFEFDNVAFNLNPVGVPEPGTLALVAAGLLGLGAARRARRAQRPAA